MAEFKEYASMFFWSYKRRDNVEYNFSIIETLISDANNNPEHSNFYYKPIFIIIMAIVECAMYDLLCRIQEHVYETVHLNSRELENIRNIDLPAKLKNYNDICRKNKLLGEDVTFDIYQSIENLIELRNRIHIQNEKSIEPLDEYALWTVKSVKEAGTVLEKLFLFLSSNHPRPNHIHESPILDSFPTPWNNL